MNRLHRRAIRALVALSLVLLTAACSEAGAQNIEFPVVSRSLALTRITGADMPQTTRFGVYGTDLAIPYVLENGHSIGYWLGDTFTEADPNDLHSGPGWRSPVMLRSGQMPRAGQPIEFDSAAGLAGEGIAPEVMYNGHRSGGEYTVIPTDGISFPETGHHIMSYMSIREWSNGTTNDPEWKTNYAGLAWSPDGNRFYRMGPIWRETPEHDSPFQMWSMQREGDFVYMISVRAGRRPSSDGPMALFRVPWNQMLTLSEYQCWNGTGWGEKCTPILTGSFGEPSLRRLKGGVWAMSYLDVTRPEGPSIVTRFTTSPLPTDGWSEPKVQVTPAQVERGYGGAIHPWSTPENLFLVVSTFQPGKSYGVLLFNGTL